MIPERILFITITVAALWAGAKGIEVFARRAAEKGIRGKNPSFPAQKGTPTLLYFWSEGCSRCPLQETQILEAKKALALSGKTFLFSKHNAVTERELSRTMHIMTVPSTVIVDGRGSVVAWNSGFKNHRELVDQVLRSETDA
jgi:hypothetical protein